jgi:hypothetical protein
MSKARTIQWARFPPNWEGEEFDAVAWISVEKLESSWRRNFDYVGPGGSGKAISGRYNKFGEWLALGEPVWMATVAVDDNGEIGFTDGRHRFAWLRDHGLLALPMQVPSRQAEMIAERFGTSSRVSRIYLPE